MRRTMPSAPGAVETWMRSPSDFEPLERVGEVDRGGVDAHVDRLDGARDIRAERDAEQNRHRDHGAQQTQNNNLPAPRLRQPSTDE